MNNLESNLQQACIRWFDLQFPALKPLLYAVPNGGKRNAREAARLKREGVRPGIPDLVLAIPMLPYHGLYIELKTPKGRLQPSQRDVLLRLEDQGYMTQIVRSFDEFQSLITKYLRK